jgi:hypothetical protein
VKKLIYMLIPALMLSVAVSTYVGCGAPQGIESDGEVSAPPTEDPGVADIEIQTRN